MDPGTIQFLQWHHSLPPAERQKFNQFVAQVNRQNMLDAPGAVDRRLGKYDSPGYDSTALDAKKEQGNVSFLARRVGDMLTPKNPKGLTQDLGKKAGSLGRGAKAVGSALIPDMPHFGGGDGKQSKESKTRASLKTNEERWAYQHAIDQGKSQKEALKAAAARRMKK
jgi:hypothetical protein